VGDAQGQRFTATRSGVIVLLAIAGLACLWVRLGRLPNIYDEGLTLAGADRILLGDVPYKDFWHTHPPGQIWLTAAVFWLVGESMMAARTLDAAVKVLLAISIWNWAGRLGLERGAGRAIAVTAFAFAVLWLEALGTFGYAGFPALLCGLESLRLVLRSLDEPDVRRAGRLMAGAGLVAGAGALFRLDSGVHGAAAATVTVLLFHATATPQLHDGRWRAASGALAIFASGAAVPLLLALGALAAQGVSAQSLFDTLVVYPATVFPDMRRLPPPAPSWRTLAFYVPIGLGVLGLARGVLRLKRSERHDTQALGWCALSLLVLAAIPQARTRADLLHQLPVLLPTLPLAAAWGEALWRRGPPGRAGAAMLAPLFALTYLWQPATSWLGPPPTRSQRDHGLARAAGVALRADQAAAVRAVQRLAPPGAFVYVGNGRHDRSVANDALFYFLAARQYPTYYHNLLPGLTTREAAQRIIVSDLRSHGVRYVVLCTQFDEATEPNASRESGSADLDAYLRGAYGLTSTIGQYQVWVRR